LIDRPRCARLSASQISKALSIDVDVAAAAHLAATARSIPGTVFQFHGTTVSPRWTEQVLESVGLRSSVPAAGGRPLHDLHAAREAFVKGRAW
jgi:hypothetical protein